MSSGFDEVESPRVRQLLARIATLSLPDLSRATVAAQTLAFHGVYSSPKYLGSAWWVPSLERTADGAAAAFSSSSGVSLTACGHRFTFKLHSLLARVLVVAALWLAGWTLMSAELFERGGVVFDPALTVLMAALVGTAVCHFLGIPAIVGCMWMGILWNNVPSVGHLTSGIVPEVRIVSSNVGLAVILMRAGLSVSLSQLKAMWLNTAAFSSLPFIAEATIHAITAKTLFSHDSWTWAFLQGFVASPVAPGVIVPSILQLQAAGVGLTGPTTLLLSSVVEDMIIGIWGINFLVGLIFDSGGSLTLSIVMGPLQIVGGFLLGILEGVVFYYVSTHVLENEARVLHGGVVNPEHDERCALIHSWIVFFTAMATLGMGLHLGVAGGAALCVMVAAATCAHMWTRDGTEASRQRRVCMGGFFATLWDQVVMPALFAMSGSSVVLADIFDWAFFWRAIVCLLVGIIARLVVAPFCAIGLGFSWRQNLFLALAWVGKGAAQGALGGIAMQRAIEVVLAGDVSDGAFRAVDSGAVVRDTGALAILVGAPLSAVCIMKLGPVLLRAQ